MVNIMPPKETNKSPITDLEKGTSVNYQFKIILFNKFSEPQEHTDNSEIRKTMHEQNENLDKEPETIKKHLKLMLYANCN